MGSGWLRLMNNQAIEDEELIALVANGNRDAFETLYDRHAPRALGLAMRMCGDRTAAEDIVQEAYWRVWKRAATFDRERGGFQTWLLTIVHHLAVDRLRSSRGAPPLVETDADDPLEIQDKSQDVPHAAWASLRSDMMRTALTRLPDAQRLVIEMAYFDGLTRQEIAARLREPLGTIHTRARLGLLKLRELLIDYQGMEP